MSERTKVRFSFHIEIDVENGSDELQKSAELSAAGFMEMLEAKMDQHIAELRKKYPECNFSVGQGNDGEEWKG